MSNLKILSCGHIYSAATWKDDSVCWFCDLLQNGKTQAKETKVIRGYRLCKDGKTYIARTLKQMQQVKTEKTD